MEQYVSTIAAKPKETDKSQDPCYSENQKRFSIMKLILKRFWFSERKELCPLLLGAANRYESIGAA